MLRRDVYLTEEQDNFLCKLAGTISEHIRRAIDDYIEKLTKKVSASQSKRKGGE